MLMMAKSQGILRSFDYRYDFSALGEICYGWGQKRYPMDLPLSPGFCVHDNNLNLLYSALGCLCSQKLHNTPFEVTEQI